MALWLRTCTALVNYRIQILVAELILGDSQLSGTPATEGPNSSGIYKHLHSHTLKNNED